MSDVKRGFLVKERDVINGWRRRYFVLNTQRLLYYLEEHDDRPRGFLVLAKVPGSLRLQRGARVSTRAVTAAVRLLLRYHVPAVCGVVQGLVAVAQERIVSKDGTAIFPFLLRHPLTQPWRLATTSVSERDSVRTHIRLHGLFSCLAHSPTAVRRRILVLSCVSSGWLRSMRRSRRVGRSPETTAARRRRSLLKAATRARRRAPRAGDLISWSRTGTRRRR
jgi:hypothetical protein